jgi:hypothetical protein
MQQSICKLKAGDIIEVHGWIMLKGLTEGKWKVKEVKPFGGTPAYYLTRPRGKKVIGFYYHQIDGCIRDTEDGNRIEILKSGN